MAELTRSSATLMLARFKGKLLRDFQLSVDQQHFTQLTPLGFEIWIKLRDNNFQNACNKAPFSKIKKEGG